MALYFNGSMIGGVNFTPRMTLEEYNALEIKPTYWIRTDAPGSGGRISADEVIFDTGVLGNLGDSAQTAIQDVNFGLVPKTTTFNADGTISAEGEGFTSLTTFNADGSITETYTIGGETITKITSFNGNEIDETITEGGVIANP